MATHFQEQFQKLKKEHGLTHVAIGLKLGLDKSTVSRRVRGELAWTRQELETVCDLFHLNGEQATAFIEAGLAAYRRDGMLPQLGLERGVTVQDIVQDLNESQQAVVDVSRPDNQQKMLNLVETFWIKGVLEASLHGAALLALGLKERATTVHHPWNLRVSLPGQADRPLPPGTDLLDVFDDAQQTLLILGRPGSGKTTLLLDLCRRLIDRARAEAAHPMPVVFNLSTWSDRYPRLEAWLMAEMKRQYTISERISRPWLAETALCLLLDGLDEVAPEDRADCVAAINAYRLTHTFAPLVLCSRTAAYETLTTKLHATQAVAIQPLTPAQIDAYVAGTGTEWEAVRHALHTDAALRELAATPLMLNLMLLAYRGQTLADLRSLSTLEAHRDHILETYIAAALQRRPGRIGSSTVQTRQWLTWLADQMTQRNLTLFLLEDLSPDWLVSRSQKRGYRWLMGLSVGLSGGLMFGLMFGGSELYKGVIAGLDNGLRTGLISGLSMGVSLGLNLEVEISKRRVSSTWSWLKKKLSIVLTFGLMFGLGMVLDAARSIESGLLIIVVIGGFIAGLLHALIWGVSLQLNHIEPVEYWAWSWPGFRKILKGGLMFGLIGGGGIGLFVGLVDRLSLGLGSVLFTGLMWGLVIMLISGLIGGLLGGLRGKPEVKERVVPNQGIWLSARNGLKIGLISGLMSGLVSGLFVGLPSALSIWWLMGLNDSLIIGLYFGMTTGLIVGLLGGFGSGLSYGGLAWLRHFITRFLLARRNCIPYHYIPFLDHAADCILLQRVGPGYRFIHRVVQEYLARQGEEDE